MYVQRRNRSRRVCIQEEEKTDPWTLLDPHEKTSSENKPLRKGKCTILSQVDDEIHARMFCLGMETL